MRLQPAMALDDYQDRVSGFGDREDRQARRAARRARRRGRKEERREKRDERKDARKERKAERRVDRIQRKKAKVRDKLSRVPGPAPAPAYPTASSYPSSSAVRPSEPSLQPAPMTMPDGTQAPPDEGWLDEGLDQVEEVLEEEPELIEEVVEEAAEATEGIGAFRPFQRMRQAIATRRAAVPAPTADAGAWGPAVRMGHKLRIQAAAGHRAAVIDLKPGLYLVAELPDAVARTEFGIAPILAPLMITAARNAIDDGQARPPEQRRGLAALFQRRADQGRPFRLFRARARDAAPAPAAPVAPAPAPAAPLALPGPVAAPPDEESFVLPAPNVGWADDRDVATVLGCEPCERRRR